MARIIIKNGQERGDPVLLKAGANSIGRAEGNDICIPHPSVSSHHCVLIQGENGLLIKDLGSTNGTFLNGQSVTETAWSGHEEILLGDIQICLEPEPECEAEVSIPERPVTTEEIQPFAEDGTPLCFLAKDRPADLQCSQCGRYFCWEKSHHLGINGGTKHHYCPTCGGECRQISLQGAGRKNSRLSSAFDLFMKALYPDSKRAHRKTPRNDTS